MKLLSQRDPQWAGDKLGASTLTIGRWGCTTTSISMLSDYFGCYRSPQEIAHDAHNYTADGLVLWKNIKFTGMRFVKRVYGNTDSLMPEIIEALKDPDRGVVLQVNDGAHWVAAYSTKMFSSDLAVADPWELPCKVLPVLKRYKNIVGAAYYERIMDDKPAEPEPPIIRIPSKKLIKGMATPEIYYYNGVKKFQFPNWHTFIELGGNMADVEMLHQEIIDSIPNGRKITNINP